MTHYLVVFDRQTGHGAIEGEYVDPTKALRERFEVERNNRDAPSLEVVVLTARSESELQRTHARYFRSTNSLAEQLSSAALTDT